MHSMQREKRATESIENRVKWLYGDLNITLFPLDRLEYLERRIVYVKIMMQSHKLSPQHEIGHLFSIMRKSEYANYLLDAGRINIYVEQSLAEFKVKLPNYTCLKGGTL